MKESLFRIRAMALNTLTELLRQKVLNLVLLFALVVIACSTYLTSLTYTDQIKFLKDFGLGAINIFGAVIALLGTAQLIPAELESRTIYTILSKPVRRVEFLLGKYLGILSLLFLAVSLMTLVFAAVLVITENQLVSSEITDSGGVVTEYVQRHIDEIHQQARDPRLIQAFILSYAKLALAAGIALFISTFATSVIFTVGTSCLVYVIGHLESTARDVWLRQAQGSAPWFQKTFLGVVSVFIPDFSGFNIVDDIVAGNRVPWSHTIELLQYSVVYLIVLLAVGQLIFNEREI